MASRPFWAGLAYPVWYHRPDLSLDGAATDNKWKKGRQRRVPAMTTCRQVTVSLMLMSLALLCACSKNVDPSRLPGRYEAHHENGLEILDLRADGVYMHEFRPTIGAGSIYSNKWRFDPFGGEPRVILRDFTPHFPNSQKGDVLLDVDKEWGRIRLYRSYDLNQYYVQKPSK